MSGQPALDPRALDPRGRHLLAFSGGPDSVCLLHALLQHDPRRPPRVVHVDHGMDDGSAERARRACRIAEDLRVACRVERLDSLGAGGGPEAAARTARYERLRSLLRRGEHLLTAHHADDQVETVLLRLLRGAGPTGLAGMQPLRAFPPGRLGRPLLAWRRNEIMDYLRRHGLHWVDDPTNRDTSLDRNYLRGEILPAIERRWPGFREPVGQAARWQRSAADALADRARRDWLRLWRRRGPAETVLDLAGWLALEPQRAFAVIRHWWDLHGLESPPVAPLREFREQCGSARQDRQPALEWPPARLHAWRGRLWLDRVPSPAPDWHADWTPGSALPLPMGGTLHWTGPVEAGETWTVRCLKAGDRLAPRSGGPRREMRQLLSEAGVPPWRRPLWPVVLIDREPAALGDDWLEAAFAARAEAAGARLEWRDRPRGLLI